MALLVVLAIFVVVGVVGVAFGADSSRPNDPRCVEPQWPFSRHSD